MNDGSRIRPFKHVFSALFEEREPFVSFVKCLGIVTTIQKSNPFCVLAFSTPGK
jgi:hypothetical protein